MDEHVSILLEGITLLCPVCKCPDMAGQITGFEFYSHLGLRTGALKGGGIYPWWGLGASAPIVTNEVF